MWKIAHVRDEKKNITTKEKISLLKTSEYSDFEPFWHKKRYITKKPILEGGASQISYELLTNLYLRGCLLSI